MDDRTQIAKDVLCAMIASNSKIYENGGSLMDNAVQVTDRLMCLLQGAEPNFKYKQTPPPAAPKGPVWRKMSEHPDNGCNVLAASTDPDAFDWAKIVYWDDGAWWDYATSEEYTPDPTDCWCEIPRPEVSE